MDQKKRIILVGFMGSGKTNFGKKLANKLNLSFIDSDLEIELNENRSINQIFEEDGEESFRKLEQVFIQNLIQSEDSFILSTGGGLPCFEDNMNRLNELGTTIYLELSPKALLKRLENGLEHRPLLRNLNEGELLKYIETKLSERSPFYQKAKIVQPGLSLNSKAIKALLEKI